MGREDLKIEIVQSGGDDKEILESFTYIIDNKIEFSMEQDDDHFNHDEIRSDESVSESCYCKKRVNTCDESIVKYSCSTIDCSCFARNYHDGKHFCRDIGILELDYLFPIVECSDDCSCDPTRCKNKLLPYHYMGTVTKPLYLFSVGEGVGFGVKCRSFIKKGEFISEYLGQVLSDEQANDILNSKLRDKHNYLLIVKEYFHVSNLKDSKYETRRLNINAEKYGNVSRFFNHSCEPNLTWRVVRTCSPFDNPRLFFFSAKDIPENTELTFDYGEGSYSEQSTIKSISQRKCMCNSSNCKGFLPHVHVSIQ